MGGGGSGKVDLYDYVGLRRNKEFFLLKDYVSVLGCGLKNTLADRNITLVGDVCLCERLADYLAKYIVVNPEQIVYEELTDGNLQRKFCSNKLEINESDPERLYLIVISECANNKEHTERLNKIKAFLDGKNIKNYTDYFSYTVTFVRVEKQMYSRFQEPQIIPKRIVLGSIDGLCGNHFFRELLDSHPAIMMMTYINLNNDLFWICVRLAGREVEEIVPIVFEELYSSKYGRTHIDSFLTKMRELLLPGRLYSSQELFVILHICFMYMMGRDIDTAGNMVIYWEPHQIPRYIEEEYAVWLGNADVSCDIVNVVRNVCMNNGAYIKYIFTGAWKTPERNLFCRKVMGYPHMGIKMYAYCNRLILRFEDIKLNPREELQKLCDEWEISWSETLMETTIQGNKHKMFNQRKYVQDFDLEPVYNLYEEYFSEFDRFRLTMICAPWQKEYGYPYVDILLFSRREVQEMFAKNFRFMKNFEFKSLKEELLFNIKFQSDIRKLLWKVRMYSLLETEKGK